MPLPRIAIVGRPNVGKSSLLNMIAGDKISIVDPTAGTTRDRVSAIVELTPPDQGPDSKEEITAELTDTGGFGVYVTEGARFNEVGADLATLTGDIEHQISQAVKSADVVLLVIDAQKGVTATDEHVARLLRERVLGEKGTRAARAKKGGHADQIRRRPAAKRGAPEPPAHDEDLENGVAPAGDDGGDAAPARRTVRVLVVANKCDGPKWEAHAAEAANLGFGEFVPVSAKTNYFRRDFLDALYLACRAVPGVVVGRPRDLATPEMKLAIIGKRNAGKSSLVNALAGEERVIVSEIAGTTRDAVDVRFEMDGKAFVAIDTAGLRKKKSFQDRIEWYALDRATRAVARADVVLLLVDATEPVSQVDQQLAMIAQRSYKPVVVVVNKWDLAEGRPAKGMGAKMRSRAIEPEMYEEYLRKEFKGLSFAPLAFISAKEGMNLRGAVRVAFDLHRQAEKRVSTGKLNRLLKDILATRGPSSKLGTFAKAYFIAQVAVGPPTIAIVVNKPELFTPNYKRFLLNRIREHVPYPEVPIKLLVKGRTRAKPEDLVEGERQRLREEGAAVVTDEGRVEPRRIVAARPLGADEDFSDAPDLPVNAALMEDLGDDAEAYFDDDEDLEDSDVEGAEDGDDADQADDPEDGDDEPVDDGPDHE